MVDIFVGQTRLKFCVAGLFQCWVEQSPICGVPGVSCWSSLARLGLLKKNEGGKTWTTLKKSLRLVVDDMPEHEMG